MEKEKTRAPFEFFRSQVAPCDVLPLVKPHQWCTLTLEVRANYEDYEGCLHNLHSWPALRASRCTTGAASPRAERRREPPGIGKTRMEPGSSPFPFSS